MSQLQTTEQQGGQLAALLKENRYRIEALLPAHMQDRARKVMASVMACAQHTPALLECTAASVLSSVLTLARQGLIPGWSRSDAYLIPFKDKRRGTVCQILYDYRGLEKLARNSGEIKHVRAEVVRENDDFDFRFGTDEFIRHKPGPAGNRGKLTHAWAVVETTHGGRHLAVLDREEVEKIKASSRGAGQPDSPWKHWEERMWRKSAIKRALNDSPQSDELMRALDNDGRAEVGKPQILDDLGTFGPETAEPPQEPAAPRKKPTPRAKGGESPPQPAKSSAGPAMSDEKHWQAIAMHFQRLELDVDVRHRFMELTYGDPSMKALTAKDAHALLKRLETVTDGVEIIERIRQLEEEEYERRGEEAVNTAGVQPTGEGGQEGLPW